MVLERNRNISNGSLLSLQKQEKSACVNSFGNRYASTGDVRNGKGEYESVQGIKNMEWNMGLLGGARSATTTSSLFLVSSNKKPPLKSAGLRLSLFSKNEDSAEKLFELCSTRVTHGINICDSVCETVELLLKNQPKLIEKIDPMKGYNALHFACSNTTLNNNIRLIQTLVQASQRAVGVLSDDDDMTCLGISSPNSSDAPVAAAIVRQKSSVQGELPLHLACKYAMTCSLNVFEYLVQCNPAAVCLSDTINMNLPIHYLCMAATLGPINLELVLLLVQKWPESTMIKNRDGDLPLHLASTLSLHSIGLLQNDETNTSDDLAIDNGATMSTDDLEDDSAEQSLYRSKGYKMVNLPKHVQTVQESRRNERQIAKNDEKVRIQKQLEIVQYLVDLYPDALYVSNNLGLTPLQVACTSASLHTNTSSHDQNTSPQLQHPIIEFLKVPSGKFSSTDVATDPNACSPNGSCENEQEDDDNDDDDDDDNSIDIGGLPMDTFERNISCHNSYHNSFHNSHHSFHNSFHESMNQVLNYLESNYTIDASGRDCDDDPIEITPWQEDYGYSNATEEVIASNNTGRFKNRRMSLSNNGRINVAEKGITVGGRIMKKADSFRLRRGSSLRRISIDRSQIEHDPIQHALLALAQSSDSSIGETMVEEMACKVMELKRSSGNLYSENMRTTSLGSLELELLPQCDIKAKGCIRESADNETDVSSRATWKSKTEFNLDQGLEGKSIVTSDFDLDVSTEFDFDTKSPIPVRELWRSESILTRSKSFLNSPSTSTSNTFAGATWKTYHDGALRENHEGEC